MLAPTAAAPPSDDETSDGEVNIVTAQPALREVRLTGFTRARARLPLVAEVEGRVEQADYDLGDAIEADGNFAKLDDSFLRLELDELLVQQEQLRSQIEFDQREVSRYRKLAKQSNAAASQLDGFEQALRNNGHALRKVQVKQLVVEERLRRTSIRAPEGWLVTARNVEPGQWVNVGGRVGEVADLTTLVVPFALTPEQHAALTEDIRRIRLQLPDLGLEVKASIYRTDPGFDPETRKIALQLRLEQSVSPQRGGLRTELRIAVPEHTGAVLLPADAVRASYEEYWVQPVDGEPTQVLLLGREDGPQGPRLRVSNPNIKAGDRFRMGAATASGTAPRADREGS